MLRESILVISLSVLIMGGAYFALVSYIIPELRRGENTSKLACIEEGKLWVGGRCGCVDVGQAQSKIEGSDK